MSLRSEIRVTRDAFTVDASIDVADGETVGLVGPNGSGKSTIVRALAGLVPVDGRVELDGTVLDAGGRRVPARDRAVGVVFQELRLFPHMSALDNVAFAARARGARRAGARREARAMLERMGIAERAEARPGSLSGGEAQRVALARALVRRPRLLLLDEPLAALDVGARRSVRALLGEVLAAHRGTAIVVSHDPVDVMTLAGRIVIVEGGRCVQQGPPDEIRRRPLSAYAAELVGVNVFRGVLEPIEPGVARLRTPEGDLVVALREPVPPGAEVIATLRPADVSIHTREPAGSARNVVTGPIASIAAGDRARVTVDGRPPVTAELTIGSLRALALEEGREVYASFKATEVTVVSG